MTTIVSQLTSAFRTAISAALGFDADPLIAPSQTDTFGDYQSNAAMSLAKLVSERTCQKTNPRAIAEQIKAKLNLGAMASQITIAGPGFINVRLAPEWLCGRLAAIQPDPRLGVEPAAPPEIVVVDYSGPNVAKEMHVGHLRSTIIGDAISRVLEFQGHQVIRQNHIGDWGTQFGMLIQFIFEQEKQVGLLSDLEQFYRSAKNRFDADPAFADQSRSIVVRLQAGDEAVRNLWQLIVEETRRHYLPIYQRLGVKLTRDSERGESAYNADLAGIVASLKSSGLAVQSEGATVVFIDGPEKSPLIIEKTGGGYLYGTTDLAAIRYRISQKHANRIIYTHDSRQARHFDQVFRTAQSAGWAQNVSLEYAPFGTMLGEDGKPFKTRSGGTVKLKELLDEAEERAFAVVTSKNPDLPEPQRRQIAHAIGIGGLKYADLSKDRVSDYVFSFDKMLALDGNTAPYLQYAYARIRSIFRKAKERGLNPDIAHVQIQLESPFELSLAKHILRFGEVIDLVARELKPHHLCAYLYDLAAKFSGFFENCPVLQSDDPTRSSRLALCDLAARTLAQGLELLGIEHPEQM